MGPVGRAPMRPALGSVGGGGGGGGAGGGGRALVGAGGGGSGSPSPIGRPFGVVGVTDLSLSPIIASRATLLHQTLALAPPGAIGELWGSAGLVGRFVLVTQGGARRLQPIGYVDFEASPDGAVWDFGGALDYRWQPINNCGDPTYGASGMALDLTGAVYCPGLARFIVADAKMVASTAPTTFGGIPALALPYVYAGWWRVAAGAAAGLIAGAAAGVAALATWERALLVGDPDTPTRLAGSGTLTAPAAKALPVAAILWGVAQGSSRALFSGSWQPDEDAAGSTPGATTTQGAAGQALAVCLGARGGGATNPAAVVWRGFEVSGQLAA